MLTYSLVRKLRFVEFPQGQAPLLDIASPPAEASTGLLTTRAFLTRFTNTPLMAEDNVEAPESSQEAVSISHPSTSTFFCSCFNIKIHEPLHCT